MPASTTALLVAAIRASHLRWNHPPIFTDDYALQMTTPFWRLVATNRLLNRLIVHRLLRVFRPIHTENILRIRYAEDRLREAVAAGAAQYVILGAGLDTFSLRQGELAERLRIYEVDHPGSQAMKRQRLIAINGSVPANLVLVPVDFETDRLDEQLTGGPASIPAPRRSFPGWEPPTTSPGRLSGTPSSASPPWRRPAAESSSTTSTHAAWCRSSGCCSPTG